MKKFFVLVMCLSLLGFFLAAEEKEPEKKDKEKEVALPMITESVTVEAKVPRDLPYAATSELKAEKIELLKPRDLSDVLSYTPGTYVSTGAKNEWGVKLRGLGTNRKSPSSASRWGDSSSSACATTKLTATLEFMMPTRRRLMVLARRLSSQSRA